MAEAARVVDARRRRRMMLLLTAIAAVVVLYVIWRLVAASEEPTIKIKGGSVVFELDSSQWVDAGQPTWSHNGPVSTNQHYVAELTTGAGKSCDTINNPVRHVTVVSSDGQRVVLRFNQGRTLVNPGEGSLSKGSDGRLRLVGPGDLFVQRIELRETPSGGNPNWSCDFANAAEFRELALCGKAELCD